MPTTTARSIVLESRPKGVPTTENFRLESTNLGEPGEGEFLVRCIWLSLDPYMRGRMNEGPSYAPAVEIGGVMAAECVGEVVSSNHPGFEAGDIVCGGFGWADHAISDGTLVRKLDPKVAPISTALGALGMPGFVAWISLNEIAQAKSGETIVVSAATGAVGTVLGQLARLKGLRTIGVAGGPEKCTFAVNELGYDACLDHHSDDLAANIDAAAPNGVDIYHENVAGKTLEAVVPAMNTHGRIVVCGMIAWNNGEGTSEAMPLPGMWRSILVKRLRVQGMIFFDHSKSFPAFISETAPLVKNGSLQYRETIAEGLDAAPEAFLSMLRGGNLGKQLVRVGADPA